MSWDSYFSNSYLIQRVKLQVKLIQKMYTFLPKTVTSEYMYSLDFNRFVYFTQGMAVSSQITTYFIELGQLEMSRSEMREAQFSVRRKNIPINQMPISNKSLQGHYSTL